MFCDSVGSSGLIKASVYNVFQYFLKLSAPTTSVYNVLQYFLKLSAPTTSVYNVLQYFLKLSAPTTSDKLKQAANAYEEEVAEEMELLTLDMVRKIRFLAKEIIIYLLICILCALIYLLICILCALFLCTMRIIMRATFPVQKKFL